MTRRQFLTLAASGIALAGSLGVTGALEAQDNDKVEMRDLIVVVPGILGSTLSVKGKPVWAPSVGAVDRLLLNLWQKRDGLFLTHDSPDTEDLGDGVTADSLMPDIHLVPGLWKVDGYSQLRQEISQFFKISTGSNYFEFPYDWRRDNRAAAHRLRRLSSQWLMEWRKQSGNAKAKLVLICHSMGGLVARYFLEPLGGWQDTRALITFGTPYRGSVKALDYIANGYKQDFPLLGGVELSSLTQLLRSFTSVYQLFPTYSCCVGGGATPVTLSELNGVPNVDMDRVRLAREFYDDIDHAAKKHLKEPEYNNNRYGICPVVGIEQPTMISARLENGHLMTMLEHGINGGDGTVPRVSAKPESASATYVAELHASLQNSSVSFNQVEGFLTEPEFVLKGADTEKIELESADAYPSAKPIIMRVYPHNFPSPIRMKAAISDPAGKKIAGTAVEMKPTEDGWYLARFEGLPVGAYRVTVASGDKSVADVFAVL